MTICSIRTCPIIFPGFVCGSTFIVRLHCHQPICRLGCAKNPCNVPVLSAETIVISFLRQHIPVTHNGCCHVAHSDLGLGTRHSQFSPVVLELCNAVKEKRDGVLTNRTNQVKCCCFKSLRACLRSILLLFIFY